MSYLFYHPTFSRLPNRYFEFSPYQKETDEQEFKGYEVELAMNEGMAFGPLSFPRKPGSQQKRRKIKKQKGKEKELSKNLGKKEGNEQIGKETRKSRIEQEQRERSSCLKQRNRSEKP
jgi:hypothetical protein